ncbi:MAG: endonuclease MutS2 [Cyclobacteriaceae bacterium]
MIYPFDFEQRLGFDQLKKRIESYCLSALGVKNVEEINFSSDFDRVKLLLLECSEAKSILEKGEHLPLINVFDPSDLYPIISIEGAFVEAEALHEIALSVDTIKNCVKYITKSKDALPSLFVLARDVSVDFGLIDVINTKIDDAGAIKDSASPELLKIRKKLKDLETKARKLIDQLFREAASKGYVPEGMLPVMREGRVVIPILPEFKRKLRGVVMGESGTGQTVFMEPSEAIEANNDIRELELEERKVCVKILRALTQELRHNLPSIKEAFSFIGRLDFINAKSKLALELDAGMPLLVNKPILEWHNARHPLLIISHKDKAPVIPLTIDLIERERFILVSGPNAGGKSVCLKTVGLIQYMLQSGILVPLEEHSKAGIFDQIFLDIGDQQSIENDLSTYSSHLRNMRNFVKKATDRSLVLMDELGAGTDPNFGGGIAQAILKDLVGRKVWGVATTHYYNLKLFAEEQEGIRNAAMQFDSKKLEPMFSLEIGKPGSSFALEIAKKIGLPKSIITEAEQIIGKDLTGLESLIKKVADEKQALKQREEKLQQNEKKYQALLTKYESLSAQLEAEKKDILNKAKSEASLLLKQTNKEIEKTIRHIKENRAEKKETRKIRQSLQALEQKIKPQSSATLEKEELVVGNKVRLAGQEVVGTLISTSGKVATVEFGEMRSTVPLSKLVKAGRSDVKEAKSKLRAMGIDLVSRQSQFSTTLDVRGKRAEEVMSLVNYFIDDAVLLGHGELKILHGKGEGVLRKVVREQLKFNTAVATFQDEHVERGGAGITQVVLK